MIPVDMKWNFLKSGKIRVTPQQFQRILTSRAIIFHFLIFLWHLILNYHILSGAFFILFYRTDLVNQTCGYGLQYITIWNQVIEQTYFNACLLQDILQLIPDPKYEKIKLSLHAALPYVFTSIIFPLSILVGLNFWTVYVPYPRIIDEWDVTASYFPKWVNHGLHTSIFLLVFLEKFIVHRPYPSKIWAFAGIASVVASYFIVCGVLYCIGGVWPYPMIGMMTLTQKIIFAIGNWILGCIIIQFGRALNNKIWDEKHKKKEEGKSK